MADTQENFRKPSQLRAFWSMTWYSFRAQTRNKATFAFGFLFPVVFVCVFGLIGNSQQSVSIGIPNTSDQSNFIVQTVKSQSFVKVDSESESALELKLRQGSIGGIMSVLPGSGGPPSYNIQLITSTAIPQEAQAIQSLLQGIVDKANLQASGVTNPPVSLNLAQVAGRQSRYIDFALPGMIGFALLGTAIFGTVFGIIFLKKSLVLKRMFATPVHPFTILFAQGTSRLIMAELQTVLIIAIGVLVFHFYLPDGFLTFIQLLILSAFGLTAFLGFGYFMAGLANDENSANPLVNLVTLPQLLLSGTFFATNNLPPWIQPIANNLPLSYFNLALRKVTTDGGTFVQALPYVAGLLVWGLVMYILAAKTFKWE